MIFSRITYGTTKVEWLVRVQANIYTQMCTQETYAFKSIGRKSSSTEELKVKT